MERSKSSISQKIDTHFVFHSDYIFCSPLYDEIVSLCVDLGELDAAIAIVADLETTGITVPDQTLDRVIAARQNTDNPNGSIN